MAERALSDSVNRQAPAERREFRRATASLQVCGDQSFEKLEALEHRKVGA
jgi:hypothetical protein